MIFIASVVAIIATPIIGLTAMLWMAMHDPDDYEQE